MIALVVELNKTVEEVVSKPDSTSLEVVIADCGVVIVVKGVFVFVKGQYVVYTMITPLDVVVTVETIAVVVESTHDEPSQKDVVSTVVSEGLSGESEVTEDD